MSNWKDRVPITKMGKIVGRVGWGRNQEFRFDICDTSGGDREEAVDMQVWSSGDSSEFEIQLWASFRRHLKPSCE